MAWLIRLFASLRTRLFLLILIAVLPMLGLIFYFDLQQRQRDMHRVETDALQLVRMAATSHQDLLEHSHLLLSALALLPQIQGHDYTACHELLARVVQQNSQYANLAVAEPNGNILCSALPFTPPANIADRPHFQRALQTRAFAVGSYQIGLISKKASLSVGYPLFDSAGHVHRVLITGLDLGLLNQLSTGAQLAEGSRLLVIDRNGLVLARQPDPENWVGKSVADHPIIQTILTKGEGTSEGIELDDVPRLFAFTPLDGQGDKSAYVAIGIPSKTIFAEQDTIFARQLFALALVTLTTGALAWLGINQFVVRRVNTLLPATRKLAAGDLSARTELPYGIGELSELAQHFDEMASALEQRAAQQKQIQDALRQAEAKYHSLIEQLPVFVYRVEFGHNGKWLYASPQIEKILGYTAQEWQANPNLWRQQLHPDDIDIAISAGAESHQTGNPFQVEYRMLARNGRIVWIRDEAIVIPATTEQPAYMQGIMTNVTEHRQIEEAIHESEERFRTFIEQTVEGVVLVDETSRVIEWNPAMTAMTGLPRKQALGAFAWELQMQFAPPEQQTQQTRQRFIATLEKLVHAEADARNPHLFQVMFQHPDGTTRIFEQRSFLVPTTRGYRIGTIARDVTNQKRIERELQDERDFIFQVVNNMGQGLTVIDEHDRFVFVNPAYARMVGRDPQELLGKKPRDVTRQEDHVSLTQARADRAAGKTTTYETRFRHADGTHVHALITGVPRMQEGKYIGAIAVITNLTERLQMEQALRASQRQLEFVLQGSNDGFWDWDIISGAVQYSERWASMLGYRLDEIEPNVTTWERLVHPDDFPSVQRALQNHLEGLTAHYETEHRLRTKSGEWQWVLDRGKVVERDETGKPLRATGTHTDITEQIKAREQLKYLGTHDALTQLYNRAYFESELTRLDGSRQFPVSIMMVDVDGLKQVNDHLGHLAGDELLQRAATVLVASFRAEDVIARIGGDEFAVLLPYTDAETATHTGIA